ncbi:RdgB/HAM1 family non-canonical purine NTP pyrophosphatase [Corynebacterium sp. TAE3-ERU12]|uniref:RdgB/HAM1 family non-canonical purine NTP pyrophosphatase n=1 Tax=Corynebacterium sp. TAE3-ERU12 TaxID=2849491 RepID=UPI001C48CFD9|nr:RdgB/HAM1 family non-canonical purine NTP pyrophosphatase [Corynebacterium sp. TAE3-ERU12]MBV7294884.1 RdgB/HAM1 family non-canonical purine NTP pyrophosphatase [Corynebacterium sp. TAE3-ERU12]
MKLLVASRNAKKLIELEQVLADADLDQIELVSMADVDDYPERPETGATFEDNAIIKAIDGANATGMACLADDSGLSIEALGGMPGVLSARWAGKHGADTANLELVLAQMADIPAGRRSASFMCAIAIATPGQQPDGVATVRGQWPGRIAEHAQGDGGFGYDPIFIPAEEDQRRIGGAGMTDSAAHRRTAAELSAEQKNAISHRGRALRQAVSVIEKLAGEPGLG